MIIIQWDQLATDFLKQTKSHYSLGALSCKAMALEEYMIIPNLWQLLKTF